MAGATTTKTKVVITGSDDSSDPMNSIKKLLAGFCDPARPEEDDASLDFQSRQLPSDKSPLQQYAEGGLTNGVEASVDAKASLPEVVSEAEADTDATGEPESIEVAAEKFVSKKETSATASEEPHVVLKTSPSGSDSRFMRGFSVMMFAMLAVVATLLILNHLGYEVDLKVVETKIKSEHQKLIGFVLNEKVAPTEDTAANGKYDDELKMDDTPEPAVKVETTPKTEEEDDDGEGVLPEEPIEPDEPEPPKVDESNGDEIDDERIEIGEEEEL